MNDLQGKFRLLPIPAKEGDFFHQDCGFCDQILKSGIWVIVIQICKPENTNSLFLGCHTVCPLCATENIVIEVFSDGNKVLAEMLKLKAEILENDGLIHRETVPLFPT
jgi:hypothetical protein